MGFVASKSSKTHITFPHMTKGLWVGSPLTQVYRETYWLIEKRGNMGDTRGLSLDKETITYRRYKKPFAGLVEKRHFIPGNDD